MIQLSEVDTSNVCVSQKNALLELINDADSKTVIGELPKVLWMLDLVADMWNLLDYSYKGAQLVTRCEEICRRVRIVGPANSNEVKQANNLVHVCMKLKERFVMTECH